MNDLITLEEAQNLLHYDPEKGALTWRVFRGSRAKAGDLAGTAANGYLRVRVGDSLYYVHRLAWFIYYGKWPENQIDHINGNRIDNRIENLREANHSINGKNTEIHRNNTTGHSGVTWNKKRRKYVAQIKVNYKVIYLGYYTDIDGAVAARKQAEIDYGFHKNHGRKGTAVQSK